MDSLLLKGSATPWQRAAGIHRHSHATKVIFYNPTARILVAKIIPLAGPLDAEVVAYNGLIDGLVAQLNAEG